MKPLDIKQESYFTPHFKVFGAILIFSGGMFFMAKPFTILNLLIVLALALVGAMLIFTHYRLIIDAENKTYTVQTWLLGFRLGKPESFSWVDKFYINQVTESATISSYTGTQHNVKKKTYKVFMKLDNGEKIHVDTDKDQRRLEKRLDGYIATLKPIIKK